MAVVGSLVLAGSLVPAVSAAAVPIRVNPTMYSPCVEGYAAPNAPFEVKWRAADGSLKLSGGDQTTGSGYWAICSGDPGIWIAPGDKIKVSDGTNVRTFTVPNLTLSINRVSGYATGTGPAGRTLRLCPAWRYSDYVRCHSVRVGQDGSWSYTEPGGIGGAFVEVNWQSPNGDDVYMAADTPQVDVTLNKSTVTGATGTPAGHVHVQLNGGAKGTMDAIGDRYGGFTGTFKDSHGRAVTVAAGDRITADIASDADWIMPAMSATADRVADTVRGNCQQLASSNPWVTAIVTHSSRERAIALGNNEANGDFAIDFHDPGGFFGKYNLRLADRVTIQCAQQTYDEAQLKIVVN